MNVGVIGNPRYAGLAAILPGMAARAEGLGMTFYSEPPLEPYWPHHPQPIGSARLDALVTLGGDGTLLRGARLLRGAGVPVLGVNLGRVGFLTATGKDGIAEALDRLASGDYMTEERATLQAAIVAARGETTILPPALNDVIIHKGGVARLISEYRPEANIVALTSSDSTYRRLALIWGVTPAHIQSAATTDELIDRVEAVLSARNLARTGENVVITMSVPVGSGQSTNLLKVHSMT